MVSEMESECCILASQFTSNRMLISRKRNGWCTSKGTRPANLDLFQELDRLIKRRERQEGFRVAFWHIPREFNGVADGLAKAAARTALAMERRFYYQ